MRVQSVQHRSFCQEIISYCDRKLLEIAQKIAICISKVLHCIFSCCLQSNEARGPSVTQIPSKEIQDMAENIAANVLERLNIGILGNAPIPNRSQRSLDGTSLPIIGTQYDPNCPVLQRIKPLIANLLQAAFANGDEFMEEGFELVIRSRQGGLLPADVSVQRILSSFQLNSLDWRLTLKLDRNQRENQGRLYFHMREWFNGTMAGHESLTLHGVSDAVRNRFLCTFI